MDGFNTIPLDQPGLLRRVFGRKSKENALREIQNILAERSADDLAAADVETILSNYELPRSDARQGLAALYQSAVDYRARDLHLTPEDKAELARLRYVLGLDEQEATQIELDLFCQLYRAALRAALKDRVLTDEDKQRLASVVADFGLSEAARSSIYKDEVQAVVQTAFNEAIADQRLTADEEQRIAQMSDNLGVTLSHDAETQQRLERFRLLARIDNGQLMPIDPGVLLQRGEVCHARFTSTVHELRTVTKAIAYHGPAGRIRIMKGLSWRYGYVNVNRVTTEQLLELDSGTLLVTNKRLLFNGSRKNITLPLKRVIHFTLFKDAIQIEKDSGKDLFFKGTGDIELIGAILDACLHQSR